jgi:tetratricopeptide (TPR) repeat protein
VQLLREAKAFSEAVELLGEALKRQPQSVELRYDRAMMNEKLNRLDEMEADLKTVIKVKPDHAHAYNALGYSLAERGVRLPEAYELIQKAVSLAPEDAFILDSLGWVQFKLGRKDDALKTLRDAYRMRPDAEIAAHLGEVMWSLGQREEARKTWRDALMQFPGNATLTAIIAKFKP